MPRGQGQATSTSKIVTNTRLKRENDLRKVSYTSYPAQVNWYGPSNYIVLDDQESANTPCQEVPKVISYPAKSIILIGGPYGAGKSTLARRLFKGDRFTFKVDDIYDAQIDKDWEAAFNTLWAEIETKLALGEGVALELAGTKESHLKTIAKLGTKYSAEPHAIYLHASEEECQTGNKERERALPEKVIKRGANAWVSQLVSLDTAHEDQEEWSWYNLDGFKTVSVFDRKAINKVKEIIFTT